MGVGDERDFYLDLFFAASGWNLFFYPRLLAWRICFFCLRNILNFLSLHGCFNHGSKPMTHIPKGSMCIVCQNRTKKTCGQLDFVAMKPLKTYPDGTVAVKCSEFKKEWRQAVEDDLGFASADIGYVIEKRVLGAKGMSALDARQRLDRLMGSLS